MTTDQPTQAVTQADREAAAEWSFIECRRCSEYEGDFTEDLAAAFARHRTNSEPRPAGDLRDAYNRCAIIARQFAEEVNEEGVTVHNPSAISSGYEICHRIIQAASALATHSPAPMAGEVERLRERVALLEAALTPFARNHSSDQYVLRDAHDDDLCAAYSFRARHYRRARAALAAHPSTQEGGDRG